MYSIEINTGLWLFEDLNDAKASIAASLDDAHRNVEFTTDDSTTITITFGTKNRRRAIGHIYTEAVHYGQHRLNIMLPKP